MEQEIPGVVANFGDQVTNTLDALQFVIADLESGELKMTRANYAALVKFTGTLGVVATQFAQLIESKRQFIASQN